MSCFFFLFFFAQRRICRLAGQTDDRVLLSSVIKKKKKKETASTKTLALIATQTKQLGSALPFLHHTVTPAPHGYVIIHRRRVGGGCRGRVGVKHSPFPPTSSVIQGIPSKPATSRSKCDITAWSPRRPSHMTPPAAGKRSLWAARGHRGQHSLLDNDVFSLGPPPPSNLAGWLFVSFARR